MLTIDGLSGTKERIFDAAINLASTYGFDNISIRNIAKEVGIKPASIYNHFNGKEAILDSIYDYYLDHVWYAKKPLNEIKTMLKSCTPIELIHAIHYDFSEEGGKNYVRMSLITKLIYMRIYKDPRANDIFMNILISESIKYTKEIIDYGIEMGRIKPIDSEMFSLCLNGQLNIMGIKAFADQEHIIQKVDEEDRIKRFFAGMLEFI